MSQNPRLTATTNTDTFSSSQQNQTKNYLYNLDKRVESYTYDKNGNRASATLTINIPILLTFYDGYPIFGIKQENQTTTASYTLDDNLIVYGDNTYLYDEDGYLEEKTTPQGTTTYSYGTLGELQEVITPTQTISYQHNANNQRVAKLINGEITEKYLWANLTTLLAIYDNNDNLKQRFEYANQRMPVAMTTTDNTKYYLHYDQVGSLRAISDTNHNIIKEITYDTFGNILSDTNEDFKVPFGFAGGLYDSDTKLTRFGYRDYDAYTGKWTAKDPIGFGGGDSNLYGYVLGDPVGFTDPSGLKLELCKTNGWLFHTFWKVDEQSIGFYPKGGSVWYTDGQYYSNDRHHDKKDLICKEFPNNSQCVETCIINYAVYHKAPKYSLALHQCRDEALDMLKTCLIECSSKKR